MTDDQHGDPRGGEGAEPSVARVALVTGGGRGIGRVIALELARAGHDVVVGGRSLEPLERTAAEVQELGRRALAVELDVTSQASVEAALAEASRVLGAPCVVVNNAGVSSGRPFLDIDLDEWSHTLAVNATGAFLVTRTALPAMLAARWGRVINVASTAALQGFAYTAHYTASKHALLGMTRALALEVARRGVTANCVCPGFVETEMTERSIANIAETTGRTPERARQSLEAASPQRRLIQPEEVAAAVVYLASDAARGVNGDALVING